LISPLARVDALSRGILKISRLVQSVSSCITCCRMMTGGAIASCGPFFSLPVAYSVDRACICMVLYRSPSSLSSNSLFSQHDSALTFYGERLIPVLGLSLLPLLPLAFVPTGLRGRVATEGCSGPRTCRRTMLCRQGKPSWRQLECVPAPGRRPRCQAVLWNSGQDPKLPGIQAILPIANRPSLAQGNQG
jgi:hypothetical protein